MTQTDNQPAVIAHYAVTRCVLVLAGWIETNDGSGGDIHAFWLKEDRDVVVARLNDALDKHRAAA